MYQLLTIITLLSPVAHAGTPEDAAVLLSRFPSGAMPEVPSVMAAVEDLARSGEMEHLPLLQSLTTMESSTIRQAAWRAITRITGETVVADAELIRPHRAKAKKKPAVVVAEDR